MFKDTALRHYKSKMALARELGITRQAIQGWGELVPLQKAWILEELTKGRLKVKLELYRNGR